MCGVRLCVRVCVLASGGTKHTLVVWCGDVWALVVLLSMVACANRLRANAVQMLMGYKDKQTERASKTGRDCGIAAAAEPTLYLDGQITSSSYALLLSKYIFARMRNTGLTAEHQVPNPHTNIHPRDGKPQTI